MRCFSFLRFKYAEFFHSSIYVNSQNMQIRYILSQISNFFPERFQGVVPPQNEKVMLAFMIKYSCT